MRPAPLTAEAVKRLAAARPPLRAEVWPDSGFYAVGELDAAGVPRVWGIWFEGLLLGVDQLAGLLEMHADEMLAAAREALAPTATTTAGASL